MAGNKSPRTAAQKECMKYGWTILSIRGACANLTRIQCQLDDVIVNFDALQNALENTAKKRLIARLKELGYEYSAGLENSPKWRRNNSRRP